MNENKEKTWHHPDCKCPRMDNDDMGEHYYISSECKMHWKKEWN